MCKMIRSMMVVVTVLTLVSAGRVMGICPDCSVPVNDAGVGISLQIRNNAGLAQSSFAECETVKVSVRLSYQGCPDAAFEDGTVSVVTPDGVTNNITGSGVDLIGDPTDPDCGTGAALSRTFGPVSYVVQAGDIVGGNITFAGLYRDGIAYTGPADATGTAQGDVSQGVPIVECTEDGNVCNGVTSCDPTLVYGTADSRLGGCVTSDPLDCPSDSNACNGPESCDPVNGCVSGPPLDCPSDSNVCNGPESCDPTEGCVSGPPLDCPSDSNACNGPETCDPTEGCVSGPPLDCPSDENVCNGPETCDPAQGCVSGPPLDCSSDGNVCNGPESCDPVEGCVTGDPLTCADQNDCTTDTCDPEEGCQFTPIVPCGGQGCTPGFWKNNAAKKNAVAWPDGIEPTDTIGSVFDLPGCVNGSVGSKTLLQGLQGGGGSGLSGAVNILLRAAIASYLNASSDCVEFANEDVADLIADVNAALATCNRTSILSLAATLDEANNAGCPLNQQGQCSNAVE